MNNHWDSDTDRGLMSRAGCYFGYLTKHAEPSSSMSVCVAGLIDIVDREIHRIDRRLIALSNKSNIYVRIRKVCIFPSWYIDGSFVVGFNIIASGHKSPTKSILRLRIELSGDFVLKIDPIVTAEVRPWLRHRLGRFRPYSWDLAEPHINPAALLSSAFDGYLEAFEKAAAQLF